MEGRAVAVLIEKKGVAEVTMRQYKARLLKMKKFFHDNNLQEALDEEGEIHVPMKIDHCLTFLSDLHQTSHPHNAAQEEESGTETRGGMASSTLQGYKSAIVYLYKERNIAMQEELHVAFSNFKRGYKRKVEALRPSEPATMTRIPAVKEEPLVAAALPLPAAIPAHITLAREIQDLDSKVEVLRARMASDTADIISAFRKFAEELPMKVVESMREKIRVNAISHNAGAPITVAEFNELMVSFKDRVLAMVADRLRNVRGEGGAAIESRNQNNSSTTAPAMTSSGIVPNEFRTFLWDGRVHMVPEGFELPSYPVYTIWRLWHSGNPAAGIKPYKHLQAFNLKKNVDKVNLTRARRVMSALERIIYAPEHGILAVDKKIESLSPSEDNDVFNKSFVILCKTLYEVENEDDLGRFRINDKSYNTIYEHIRHEENSQHSV